LKFLIKISNLQGLENLFDFTTPIEVKLSVELKNEASKSFCKNCPYAQRNSTNYTVSK
jgi:hypothetical protein